MTVLMWDAIHGNTDCIQMRRPVSDVLVKLTAGRTAADQARSRGYDQWASPPEAYAFTAHEMTAIDVLAGLGGGSQELLFTYMMRFQGQSRFTAPGSRMQNVNDELKLAAERGGTPGLNALMLPPCDALDQVSTGLTALISAAWYENATCIDLLIPVSNAFAQDEWSQTPLMRAAKYGQSACVPLLLPVSDALSKDSIGMTALMWAAKSGHSVCVQMLLPASDAFIQDQSGLTALMHAASGGHRACVQLLLPTSVPSAQDATGMTALMWAASSGQDNCVQLLLPLSNASDKDNMGMTSSDHARLTGYHQLAALIDAYDLARGEASALNAATGPGAARKSPLLRV